MLELNIIILTLAYEAQLVSRVTCRARCRTLGVDLCILLRDLLYTRRNPLAGFTVDCSLALIIKLLIGCLTWQTALPLGRLRGIR